MNHFNPNRLALAMRARGVTKRALATRLDCSERLIGYHLNGEKSPDAYVEVYADIFHYPTSFFYADDVEVIPEHSVSFRALSKITNREKDRRIVSSSLVIDSLPISMFLFLHPFRVLLMLKIPNPGLRPSGLPRAVLLHASSVLNRNTKHALRKMHE